MISLAESSSKSSNLSDSGFSSSRIPRTSKSHRLEYQEKLHKYNICPKFLTPIRELEETEFKSRREGRPNTRALDSGILNFREG